jgi:hypothetical protein
MREAGFVPNPHARALRQALNGKTGGNAQDGRKRRGATGLRDEWRPIRIMDHHLNLLSDVPHLSETERETIRQVFVGIPPDLRSGQDHPGSGKALASIRPATN